VLGIESAVDCPISEKNFLKLLQTAVGLSMVCPSIVSFSTGLSCSFLWSNEFKCFHVSLGLFWCRLKKFVWYRFLALYMAFLRIVLYVERLVCSA
jgi:hypothetical protein